MPQASGQRQPEALFSSVSVPAGQSHEDAYLAYSPEKRILARESKRHLKMIKTSPVN